MFALKLSPLPIDSGDDGPVFPGRETQGFVDEAVINRLISHPPSPRLFPSPGQLALSSDPDDFAGIPHASPVVHLDTSPDFTLPRFQPVKRATPPEIATTASTEPGIGLPHTGGPRWWIAAAAGMSSALLLSSVLFGIARRDDSTPRKTASSVENKPWTLLDTSSRALSLPDNDPSAVLSH